MKKYNIKYSKQHYFVDKFNNSNQKGSGLTFEEAVSNAHPPPTYNSEKPFLIEDKLKKSCIVWEKKNNGFRNLNSNETCDSSSTICSYERTYKENIWLSKKEREWKGSNQCSENTDLKTNPSLAKLSPHNNCYLIHRSYYLYSYQESGQKLFFTSWIHPQEKIPGNGIKKMLLVKESDQKTLIDFIWIDYNKKILKNVCHCPKTFDI